MIAFYTFLFSIEKKKKAPKVKEEPVEVKEEPEENSDSENEDEQNNKVDEIENNEQCKFSQFFLNLSV